jgi:tetratricopeptide (TPR) repeat protein
LAEVSLPPLSDERPADAAPSDLPIPYSPAVQRVRLVLFATAVLLALALVYRERGNDAVHPARATIAQPADDTSKTAQREPAPAAPAPEAQPRPRAAQPAQPAAQATPRPAGAATDVAAQVSALTEQARALEQQGKPKQAIALYEQAVALDPTAPRVLSRLAFSYLNRGQNQQASEYAARALAVDPTSSEGWIVLGAARHALGDPHGARDAYRKCVEIGRGAYVEECRRVAR